MNEYDVIVVGASISGLVAGLNLAKKKYKVLILEKNNFVGSAYSSFIRGRFEFDRDIPYIVSLSNDDNDIFNKIFTEMNLVKRLDLTQTYGSFRVIVKNTDNTVKDYELPYGIVNFINKLEDYFPRSIPSLKTFFRLAKECKAAVNYLESNNYKVDNDVMKARFENFVEVATATVSKVLDDIDMPLSVQEIINACWINFGVPETEISFVTYACYLYDLLDNQISIPTHKGEDIFETLLDEYRKCGGEIRFNSEVDKVLIENNTVNALHVKTETTYYTKHVIFNGSMHSVYTKMIEQNEVPRKAIKLCNARKLGARRFTVCLGLNRNLKELKLSDAIYYIYDTLDTDLEYTKMCGLESSNQMAICLNKIFPDCSPKGTAIIYLTTYFFDDSFESAVNIGNYNKVVNDIAKRLINDFEKATGTYISEYIEEIEILSPLENYYATGEYVNGYRMAGEDSSLYRILNGDNEVFIKGLRFCGSFAEYGSMHDSLYLSGYLASNRTMIDLDGESDV